MKSDSRSVTDAPSHPSSNAGSAENAKERVKDKARELKDEGVTALANLKSEAQTAAQKATSAGRKLVEEQKSILAEKVREYESAAKAAAVKLRENGDEALSERIESIASRLRKASEYLQDTDIETLWEDGGRLARRHPELVLGGMFVAGLATARFLKASNGPNGNRTGETSGPDTDRGENFSERRSSSYPPSAF